MSGALNPAYRKRRKSRQVPLEGLGLASVAAAFAILHDILGAEYERVILSVAYRLEIRKRKLYPILEISGFSKPAPEAKRSHAQIKSNPNGAIA